MSDNDVGFDGEEGDTLEIHQGSILSKIKPYKKFIGIGVVVLLIVTVLCAGTIGLFFLYPSGSSNKSYKQATQYHLIMGNIDDWRHYDRALEQWLTIINSNSAYLQLEAAEQLKSVTSQVKIDTGRSEGCVNTRDVTVGYYISSDNATLTNTYWITMKGKSPNETQAENYPFAPSNAYEDSAIMLEQEDRYICDPRVRYDLQTQVSLESDPAILHCEDLLDIFPEAFPDYSRKANSSVTYTGTHYWSNSIFSGVVNSDSTYEIAFGIIYEDQSDVGVSYPDSGLFTIRLYPTNDGYPAEYNQNVLKDFDHLFQILADSTNSTDCFRALATF